MPPPAAPGCDGAPRADGPEGGRVWLLTAAFVMFAVALVGMVASATAVHLDRKHLADLADMLAASAAQAVDEQRIYAGEVVPDGDRGGGTLVLDDRSVAAAVERYLAEHPGVAPDGLRVVSATSPDGRSARVSLAAPSRPLLLGWFTDATRPIVLTATSTARAW
ncbi:hypothetical protein [Myceligenerans pegani]|uniref:Flp pilus-assembly TadG-like N-terminal domain-containing protein n=1 Tax=Myceligenerans pegani TaxID=2776917 RepID=A0ABR9N0K4_9MICO|nr:hypothetical protein [Myceligenerans sp. TRM 65318]MBE1877159.1 hypothetical protein [Myceligenerans sp. TRM 65318]MBE3019430.1 hypothetical protein [Myceligenerans sp. TRM 65318]